MIVQPDFLDHWKTLKLASVLGDPLAPVYIIRLWAYAQTSRKDIIPDDPEMIKAVCRWPGDALAVREALVSCGWLDEVDGGLRIHGWSDLNARLVHNWTVGKTGGRPRVTPDNPRDNPRVSQTKPIRVDKSRVDEIIEGIPSTDGAVRESKKSHHTPKPPKEQKSAYGELQCVKLTDAEHKKLLAKHGPDKLNRGIEILDGYIASKGVKYASHYAVMKDDGWVWKRLAEIAPGVGSPIPGYVPISNEEADRLVRGEQLDKAYEATE